MVLETDAIVLKSIPFMETSRICTFYTRRIGRITAKALGAKRKKNKFGSSIEPITVSRLRIYKRRKTNIYLLSGSYIIHPFTTIKRNIERFSSASLVIDFLYSLTPRDTGNSNLYNLSLLSLMRMKTVKNSLVPALTFLIKALTIIGYGINLKRCVICGEKENIAGISIPDGGVVCSRCKENGRGGQLFAPAKRETILFLRALKEQSKSETENIPKERYIEVLRFLDTYIFYHCGKRLPSFSFMKKIQK